MFSVLSGLASDRCAGSGVCRSRLRCGLANSVWSGKVAVLDIDSQHAFEVAAVADQQPVQAFGPDGANPAFGVGVRLRRPHRGADHSDPVRGKDVIEGGGELRVAVTDQHLEPVGLRAHLHQQLAGPLRDPGPGGVRGDAGQPHAAPVEFDDEQDVEPGQADGLDGEEVAGQHRRLALAGTGPRGTVASNRSQ